MAQQQYYYGGTTFPNKGATATMNNDDDMDLPLTPRQQPHQRDAIVTMSANSIPSVPTIQATDDTDSIVLSSMSLDKVLEDLVQHKKAAMPPRHDDTNPLAPTTAAAVRPGTNRTALDPYYTGVPSGRDDGARVTTTGTSGGVPDASHWLEQQSRAAWAWCRGIGMAQIADGQVESSVLLLPTLATTAAATTTWPTGTDDRTAMDAAACSFADALKQWTPIPTHLRDNATAANMRIRSIEDTLLPNCIHDMQRLLQTPWIAQSRVLTEAIANIVITLERMSQLRQEFYAAHVTYYQGLRQATLKAIHTLKAVNDAVRTLMLQRLEQHTAYYSRKLRETAMLLTPAEEELVAQSRELDAELRVVEHEYKEFLTKLGIDVREHAVCNALRIIRTPMTTPRSRDTVHDDATMRTSPQQHPDLGDEIALVRACIKQMREALEMERTEDGFMQNMKQVAQRQRDELHDLTDQLERRRRRQQQQQNNRTHASSSSKQNAATTTHHEEDEQTQQQQQKEQDASSAAATAADQSSPSATVNDDAEAEIKKEIALLSRAVKNTVDTMSAYRATQSSRHDRWVQRLTDLEQKGKDATDRWVAMHRDKVQYALIVEHEVRQALTSLAEHLYALLARDSQTIEHEWHEAQQRSVAAWVEQQQTLSNSRKLVSDRLLHWERQIASMPGTEALMALIQQGNEFQKSLDDAYHMHVAIEQFTLNYDAMTGLWRLLYSQTKRTDARLTPDIMRRHA